MEALSIVRMVWVGLVLGLALLAVFRAPIGPLWMPAVAATEAGYLLVLLTVPAFVRGLATPRDRWLVLAGLVSIALLLSPLVRVQPVARALPRRLDEAFGGRRDARAAFSFGRLLALRDPQVPVTTLRYGALALDLYGARGPRPRPLIVVIHGGSWSGGDRTQLPSIARRLAADGFAVASIDYRLAPAHRFPAALDDVRAAVDWLREHADELGLDRDNVVLYGRSAGAHLALLAAYRWNASYVRGVVALYAPSDLVWSWAHPANPLVLDTPKTLRAFLGGAPSDSEAMRSLYEEASPLGFVTPAAPPTLLVHGGRDELVSPEQSERLAARLARAGVPHLTLRLPWATHGCEASLAGPSGQLVEHALRRFLAAVLPPR